MTKFSTAGAIALLVMAAMLAPASASEQVKKDPKSVQTVAVAASTIDVAHRSKPDSEVAQSDSGDSNGWGMLAAGLCVGLLIIARRRNG
ncbi:MAG: hypothetical protein WCZ28_07695 [Burkholderiaceae bacterium]